jgi:hypothetical protein
MKTSVRIYTHLGFRRWDFHTFGSYFGHPSFDHTVLSCSAAGLMFLASCSCTACDLHTVRCHYRTQYKPDLFVLCAYKLKLQHILQLSPVYEKTAKIYCADLLSYITCVKSHIKTLSPDQQILFSSYKLNMFRALLCPSSGARIYNVDYRIGRFDLGLL